MSTALQRVPRINILVNREDVKRRFEEILGKRAPGFITSLLNVVRSNSQLQEADPQTVLSAAAVAASLDLPIDPNLGFAYILPYRNQGRLEGQFQLGYRGFVQLAMRTGQYSTINVAEVYEGEIEPPDARARAKGEIKWTDTGATSDKIVGYVAYFRLLNGFEKYEYMPVDRVRAHAKRHSRSYGKESSPWTTDFDEMAKKTVLKRLLSKWGILSVEMQQALLADQSVIRDGEDGRQYDYVDAEIVQGTDANSELNERLSSRPTPAPEQPVSGDAS